MKLPTVSALRPTTATVPVSMRPFLVPQRRYSSESSTKRRAVTPLNDDGRVPWTQLSLGEKTGRAAQQTFNFGFVMAGAVLTGGVAYVLYSEVFQPDSKVAHFNRAVDRIRKDSRCVELLGDAKKITAYAPESHSNFRRPSPMTSSETKDRYGVEHLKIRFNVQGPKSEGVVNIHLAKGPNQTDHEYKSFSLDVKGHERIYLANANAVSREEGVRKDFKFLGVKWN